MSEERPALPTAGEQINGLAFGMLLLSPDHVIRQANPAAESLLGISWRRMKGKSFLDILSFHQPGLVDRLRDNETQLVARGVDAKVADKDLRLNVTISTLSSNPGWRVATLSDASQGERFEGQERRGQLRGPAVLAHEIKNPLAAIRGAAQLLGRKVGENEKPLTDLIADEVDRIAQLIDRMQRLGRERAEPIVPINLHEAIHRAYETVRITSDSSVAWREEFDPSLPPVLANEGALVQVLVNLMANARDACSDTVAPRITVRTRFASGIVMNVFRLGRPVKLPIEIQVSDNGPGIDPSIQDDIFEPFVTSKTNGQGLGLALVQKLVRDMDGRVSHERDESGGWTHFRIHLPMAR
ncbi:two-component system sensor histidine kinase NtrB [Aurantiacibacter hainanensis]|uniref:two-component system sensor histidine kinase NtrB n=1 Tax=Aurantiacibacter hainanensis TaxID=3076114 RepID=UPI0030C6E46B